MPNELALYDPLFYAQEAIIALEKALGMANAIYRGYDSSPQQKGSTINISIPGTFTAQNAPSTAQDLNPSEVAISLDQWKEVKFALNDKELTYTKEKIITDHIRPAAFALADAIDLSCNGLYDDVPWVTNRSATTAPADILAARKILFDNGVPMNDGLLFAELGGQEEADLLANSAFSQWQGAGPTGEATQVSGVIGTRYGITAFANQNVPSHVSGAGGTDVVGTAPAMAVGDTSGLFSALQASITNFVRTGDTFSIAGDSQRYVVTAAASTGAGGTVTVSFYPALKVATSGGEVTTFDIPTSGGSTTKVQNLVFHRRFAALAMAPLSRIGDGLGARIETVVDPITNIALRSRIYYLGDSSQVRVALDALWGVKTLDPNRAVRMRQP